MEKSQEKHEMIENNTESPVTVLIVEDSKGVNRLIQKALEREGFWTEQALTGAEALAKVAENCEMIMLLDYVLPDMTGRQVIETLIERKCEIPFIIMTGYGDEQTAVDMMKLGARDYIIKQGNFIEMLPQVVKRTWRELDQEKRLAAAELAQRESERRFREILENVKMIAIMIDLDGKITFCNDYFLTLTGWQREEVLEQDWFSNFLPPEIQQPIRSGFMETIATGSFPTHYENEIITRSGARRLIAWTNTVLRDPQGTVIGTNSIGEDITERKQTEEKLRQLHKAVETMYLGVTITDLERKIVYVNSADATMHGYTVEELIGQDAGIFAPAELRQPMTLEQIEETKDWVRESVNIREDGTRFPVQLISDVVRDPDGRPLAIVTTCEDITERKRTAEAIAREHTLLRTLIDNLPDHIFVKDVQGRFLLNNRAHRHFHGAATQEELIGGTVFDLFPQELAAQYDADDQEVMRSGEPLINREEVKVDQEGGARWFLTTKVPLRDPDGKIIGLVGISHDITERKQTEEALQRAKDELEQRVEERTAELSKVNAELAQASRHKDEFLANMSHELRTPLNAILGYAQILRTASNLNPRQVEGLETIKRSGAHLLNMITEILDLSKIGAGRMELQVRDVYLPELLRSIGDMIRIRAEQKGLAFVCEYAPDLPVGVRTDEKRLREVLINLLSNAVKFTEKGRVTFRVGVNPRVPPAVGVNLCVHPDRVGVNLCVPPAVGLNPRVHPAEGKHTGIAPTHIIRFEVEDTGIGIAPEQLKEVFLPFYQMGGVRYSVEGTGLGLAISHKLVEMMGGELKVTSTIGEGSVFWFDLPLSEVPGFVPQVQSAGPKIVGYKGERRIVLVVDDNRDNRDILTSMLHPLGFRIVEAENGQECLDKYIRFTPDVILLDLRMPGMDGFEVACRIRNMECGMRNEDTSEFRTPQSAIRTCIIAISATAYEEARKKSLEAGCNDFLAKPVQSEDLLERLRTHLHLEWIYERGSEEQAEVDLRPQIALQSVVLLPPGERDLLLQQAVRGNVKGILEQLDNIERLGAQFLPLVTELRTLAKNFQVDQIVEWLEKMS
jgi:PAS domain S-box-containing protein